MFRMESSVSTSLTLALTELSILNSSSLSLAELFHTGNRRIGTISVFNSLLLALAELSILNNSLIVALAELLTLNSLTALLAALFNIGTRRDLHSEQSLT